VDLIVLLSALVALGLLANSYGYDSREDQPRLW
jgi:hypothetical protein